ncbi:MAG TPA: hypothetical protein VN282_21045 [Pyrinomonadaceae bacterium]|nr:hypothetical protein [Pyrinomonadaceae bacterium]
MSQQNNAPLEDWAAETHESIAARLEGVKVAQAQTRLTLGTMAVISVMMLIVSYNAYLSYDYYWVVKRNCPKDFTGDTEAGGNGAVNELKSRINNLSEHAMREWATSRTVMISLLGIRVSVDDVSVLGTAVLFFLSLWLFLVARRENHTIGFLLRDTDSRGPEGNRGPPAEASAQAAPTVYPNAERWLIYHTIISNSLFITFDSMPNVDRLEGKNSLDAAVNDERSRLSKWGLNVARGFFFAFPAVVALAVFSLDYMSYRVEDPFVFKCVPENPKFFERATIIFGACFILLSLCCWKSGRLAWNTENVLRAYGKKLRSDLLDRQQSSKS